MKTYNHAFTIAFSVESAHSNELDVLRLEKEAVFRAVLNRVCDVIDNDELAEACEGFDVYEISNEGDK